MRALLHVMLLELRILVRDRQALALLFIMPMALIFFLTLALQNVYQTKVSGQTEIAIITQNSCEDKKCKALLEHLAKSGFKYQIFPRLEDAPKSHNLILQVPDTVENIFGRLIKGAKFADADKFVLLFDPAIDYATRSFTQAQLSFAMQSMMVEEVKSLLKSRNFHIEALDHSLDAKSFLIEQSIGGKLLPNPIQQSVPAWALFGMFFIAIPLGNSFIRDRKSGVFKRLLSFPLSQSSLLAGKVLPFTLVNVIQFSLMFLLGMGLLPKFTGLQLNLDFQWLALTVVTLVCGLAATAYGLLITSLTKTPEQTHALGALSIVILAILGGIMIPRFAMPEFMQQVAKISPLYWGLEAYQDILVRKTTLLATMPNLAALGVFIAIFLLFSFIWFRWNDGEQS